MRRRCGFAAAFSSLVGLYPRYYDELAIMEGLQTMPAYGHSNGIVDEFGLHDLSDVSFNLSASQLRQVADFLTSCAEEIESGVWRTSHRHMGERDLGWKDIGVVVNHPAPDPPRHLL